MDDSHVVCSLKTSQINIGKICSISANQRLLNEYSET